MNKNEKEVKLTLDSYNKRVKERKEESKLATDKTFLANLSFNDVSSKEKAVRERGFILETIRSLYEKDELENKPVISYPFLKIVKIKWDVVNEEQDYVNQYESTEKYKYFKNFLHQVQLLKANKILEESCNLKGKYPDLYSLPMKKILNRLFGMKGDKLEITSFKTKEVILITKEEFDLHNKVQTISSRLSVFSRMFYDLGLDYQKQNKEEALPVSPNYLKYLDLGENQTIIELTLPTSNKERRKITELIATYLLPKLLSNGVEVVGSRFFKAFTDLYIQCSNDDVLFVLKLITETYKKVSIQAHSLNSNTYSINYSLGMDINYNAGTENQTLEYYTLLNGEKFEPIKERLDFKEEHFLTGFNLYR
ncbi:hypothetical protein [Bacillus toyonensis]|uniref:hypothetical protein n=1 Tax=Bacillus toyonensis TaxID=155322 RepID=UPI000BF3BFE3|nr:hypothetical protein [Bacillus toyonensis]PGF05217.1 hypothetical protein COM61_02010 [Bacillus toyonensis]